jgi:hypothetical protein
MAQATAECPQNPTRKLLILLQTNGDVQLDQMALKLHSKVITRFDVTRRLRRQSQLAVTGRESGLA